MPKHIMRCPDCGDETSLCGRADIVWHPEKEEWVIGDVEDWFDCSNCDWQGEEHELHAIEE